MVVVLIFLKQLFFVNDQFLMSVIHLVSVPTIPLLKTILIHKTSKKIKTLYILKTIINDSEFFFLIYLICISFSCDRDYAEVIRTLFLQSK